MLLRYYPASHRYYAVINGRKYSVPSVTTALQVLDKPALIPWAVGQAIDLVRLSVVPGVEHAESFLEEVYARAKREARRVRGVAADIGTQAHAVLQLPVSERPELGSIADVRVQSCVAAGLAWQAAHEIQWISQECPIYSRRHRYSGRFDGLARVDGITSLIDYKSSAGIYPEHRLQCAAYVHAIEEESPDILVEQRILIRLGKEDGIFEPHVFFRASQRQDFNAFLAALRLHRRLKQIQQEEKLSRKKKEEGQN